ncbi:MAG TPA: BatD family protein, partial [Thermoanaerobaculia bacterium]|nr:BatD family protein [Thermoanaerobaculia bacterium]
GRARVHSIALRMGNTVYQPDSQEIEVQNEPVRLARQPAQDSSGARERYERFLEGLPRPWHRREPTRPPVFVRAELEPRQPVVGQQALYTVYLYTREDIGAISPTVMPDFRGFWVRDVPLPRHLSTDLVDIDGRRYGRVPLIRKALFPLRPGRHEIKPAVIDVMVQKYERTFFFSPPVTRSEPMRLETGPESVNVRPLPPAPPGFGGAVGRIAMAVQIEPREIRLGEAATLTVSVGGTGNLQSLHEPKLALPDGLTAFPPQQEGGDDILGTTVRGTRVWRYSVISSRAGRYDLQPPRIAYFDPAAGTYQVATAPDVVLTALPRAVESAEAPEAGTPHGIRVAAADMVSGPRRWTDALPWLFALPWALALIVTLARRKASPAGPEGPRGMTGSPALARMEEALREAGTEPRPRQVAARIEEAWRDLLAERWGLPPATSSSHWRAMLAEKGVAAETLDELGRLLEDLRFLRYAPQLSATDNLRSEVLSRCRLLLRRLK